MSEKKTVKNKKLSITQVFCWWLWFASFLFLYNYSNYSPALALVLAFIFTLINGLGFMSIIHYSKLFVIHMVEIGVLYFVVKKNIRIKRSLFNETDLTITSALFLTYLLYLRATGTNFQEVYFKTIPEDHAGTTFYEFYIQPYLGK